MLLGSQDTRHLLSSGRTWLLLLQLYLSGRTAQQSNEGSQAPDDDDDDDEVNDDEKTSGRLSVAQVRHLGNEGMHFVACMEGTFWCLGESFLIVEFV